MQDPDLIEPFLRPLEVAAVEYMISGSVATSVYGEPRSTLDIDLTVFSNLSKLKLFLELFPEIDFYLPPLEVMEIECRRETRGYFNIIHQGSGYKADRYPSRSHPHLPWALKNRRRIKTGSGDAWIAPPEYIILKKLEFFQEGRQPEASSGYRRSDRRARDRLRLRPRRRLRAIAFRRMGRSAEAHRFLTRP